MNSQTAGSDYSADKIVLPNSPITKESQLPVGGSPPAVPHTNVTDPVGSVVHETLPKRRKRANIGSELVKKPDNEAEIYPGNKEELNHLLADLNRKKEELTNLRNETHAALKRKDQELNELHNRIEKKDQEIDEFRQRWKQVANELNRFLVQDQGFYQVTDQQLIEEATQLRYNVRNFADQQFGGELRDGKTYQHFRDSIKNYYEISSDSFEACMKHSSRRPMLVGAFLWAILRKDIFGKFCWAGSRGSNAMSYLDKVLGK